MKNEENVLQSLTNQPVTISLGGRSYTARRATMVDMALVEDYRNEHIKAGDFNTIRMGYYMIWLVVKDFDKDATPESIGNSIAANDVEGMRMALEQVGFLAKAQLPKEKEKATGQEPTP